MVDAFRFRKLQNIGAAGAEEDEFLTECFVDNGYLSPLEDIKHRGLILLGRTGSGKTALLRMLKGKREKNTIAVSPENLALTYVSNSNVLETFSNLGVNLDPFFKLLWRHVIVVEILSRHVKGRTAGNQKTPFSWLRSLFPSSNREDREMQDAISYLEKWGSLFWRETEFRVKEITQKLETDLTRAVQSRLGVDVLGMLTSGGSIRRNQHDSISEEVKLELRHLAQQVVSETQVQDLHNVIKMLGQVLDKESQEYYVLIDGLDENWVEERLRYRLIMALLQTAKDFISVERAKIVVALRRDLLERVFRHTRDAGFQEEKYNSLLLPIKWSPGELIEVLDRRIDRLVKPSYTTGTVTHADLLPSQVRKKIITEYIAERTQRPRDIIAFFNECIEAAPNLTKLSVMELKTAERNYSRFRLRALGDEWSAEYPSLLDFSKILQRKNEAIRASHLQDDEITDVCIEVVHGEMDQGPLGKAAADVVESRISMAEFRNLLIRVFYSTGLVGLKIEPHEPISWVDERGRSATAASIGRETRLYVHPMFRRALGIKTLQGR